MIDTWQKAEKYGEKASKNGKKPAKNDGKTAKNDGKSAKMARIAVKTAWFLTLGCCQRDQWVLPKKPLGAAEETIGCRGRNQWVPWEKPMVSAEETAGNQSCQQKNNRQASFELLGDCVVGVPGLEPGKAGPESAVLPLHHTPNMRCIFSNAGAKVLLFLESAKKKTYFL